MNFNDEYRKLVRTLARDYGISRVMKIRGRGYVKSDFQLLTEVEKYELITRVPVGERSYYQVYQLCRSCK
jgi:hypothetical protein